MNSPSHGPPPPTLIRLGEGPGKKLAPVKPIVTVCIFYTILVILVVYCFIALWPRPTASRTESRQIPAASTNAPSSNAPTPGVTSPTGNASLRNVGVVAGREESLYFDPQQGSLRSEE